MDKKINSFYLSHFSELAFEKQFHFASRLWLWNGDESYQKLLVDMRPSFAGDLTAESISGILGEVLAKQTPDFGSKNAAAQRAPYFARYPLLRRVLPLLFRLLFIETIYGVDARQTLGEHIHIAELEDMANALKNDPEAIAILSTHAANFFYLWNRFYKRDEAGVPLDVLFDIGQNRYDHDNLTHLQLLIYLYTHCIIGESLFYKRTMPQVHITIYQEMCARLEKLVENNFESINLDNKCEFLVACKIAGYETALEKRIHTEAAASFSDTGDFIIDKHNKNPQSDNTTLEKSEHRNVLFIMSTLDFTPNDRVIV